MSSPAGLKQEITKEGRGRWTSARVEYSIKQYPLLFVGREATKIFLQLRSSINKEEPFLAGVRGFFRGGGNCS